MKGEARRAASSLPLGRARGEVAPRTAVGVGCAIKCLHPPLPRPPEGGRGSVLCERSPIDASTPCDTPPLPQPQVPAMFRLAALACLIALPAMAEKRLGGIAG
jgi:hypothetical protein